MSQKTLICLILLSFGTNLFSESIDIDFQSNAAKQKIHEHTQNLLQSGMTIEDALDKNDLYDELIVQKKGSLGNYQEILKEMKIKERNLIRELDRSEIMKILAKKVYTITQCERAKQNIIEQIELKKKSIKELQKRKGNV